MKRILLTLSVILCLVLSLNIISTQAETYSGNCGTGVTYTMDTDTGVLTISGTGAMQDYPILADVPWFSYKSDVKTVVIEDGITSIGEQAFGYCENLTEITIPDGVTSIDQFAFEHCSSLKKIEIPDGVTSIGWAMLGNCESLTEVTIPSSVTNIDDHAFNDCNALTDVYFTGSEEEWNEISIGSYNECMTNATIHYNHALKDNNEIEVEYSIENNVISLMCKNIAEDTIIYATMVVGGIVKTVEVNLTDEKGSINIEDNAETVKIFVWESFESMSPLCEAIKVK